MQPRRIFYVLIFASVLLFSACFNEEDFKFDKLTDTTINPQLEANLLTMDFTARDLFDQIMDTTGSIEVEYNRPDSTLLLKFVIDTALNGSDFVNDYFNKDVNFEVYEPKSPLTIPIIGFYETTFTNDIELSGESFEATISEFNKYDQTSDEEQDRILDSVLLSSGALVFETKSSVPYELDFILKSPSIVGEDGQPLSETIKVTPGEKVNTVDLAKRKLKLAAAEANKSTLTFSYEIVVRTAGQQVKEGNYDLYFKINGRELNIDLAWGLIGNPTIPIDDEVLNIDYFSDSTVRSNTLDVEGTTMQLTLTNYTGINLYLKLEGLRTRTYNGFEQSMFEDKITDTIARASIDKNGVITPKVTALSPYDVNERAITILPSEFLYSIKSIFGDGMQKGFIRPNGKYLDIHGDVRVPIICSVTDFTSEKETGTLDFLQDEDGVGDYIDSAALKLYLENTFPAEMTVDIYTMDAYGVRSQLLSKPIIAEGAEVDDNGNILTDAKNQLIPHKQKTEVNISSVQYERLRQAEKIILFVKFNTSRSQDKVKVKFRSDSKLRVKVGARVHSKITF